MPQSTEKKLPSNHPEYQKQWQRRNKSPESMEADRLRHRKPHMIKRMREIRMKKEQEENDRQAHRQTVFSGGFDKETKNDSASMLWGYNEGEIL